MPIPAICIALSVAVKITSQSLASTGSIDFSLASVETAFRIESRLTRVCCFAISEDSLAIDSASLSFFSFVRHWM